MVFNPPASWLPFCCTAALLLAALGGCGRDEDQDEFESDAFRSPDGFTETSPAGETTGPEDPDDWRISPMYAGYLEVTIPAHPNPTRDEFVSIELFIEGIEPLNGLEVLTFDENNNPRILYTDSGRELLGFFEFSFHPSRFSPRNVYEDAVGLNRVFIYDNNQNLITYGDVEVR
ncbi:MAG: hypothetical protein WD266_06650 [Balneolales bacterium]